MSELIFLLLVFGAPLFIPVINIVGEFSLKLWKIQDGIKKRLISWTILIINCCECALAYKAAFSWFDSFPPESMVRSLPIWQHVPFSWAAESPFLTGYFAGLFVYALLALRLAFYYAKKEILDEKDA